MPEGWFNTRDLARLEDGNLFIVGRTKELIVRFGFNVYPAEVEAVLNAHPAVVQSAVIGRSVEGNEEVVAFVQLVPGSSVTATELAEYAATASRSIQTTVADLDRPSDARDSDRKSYEGRTCEDHRAQYSIEVTSRLDAF